MTRPHLIAKLLLAAAGIDFLIDTITNISSIAFILNLNYSHENITARIILAIFKFLIFLSLSFILLFRSDGIARIIIGRDTDQFPQVNKKWIIAGFQMAACFCGLIIIYYRINSLFYYIPIIVNGTNTLSYLTIQGQSLASTRMIAGVISEIIKWIFGLYLIIGAPQYVNWQCEK